jgi:hypothetical protein
MHNGMDIIDSRDVIARIAELESLRDDAQEAQDGNKETMEDGTEIYTSVDFQEDEYTELKQLTSLAEDASGSPDWKYGEALIRDSYFQDYAQQLAEDCGMIQKSDQWPNRCIDWEKAADELKQDYVSVEFGDETYWIRA